MEGNLKAGNDTRLKRRHLSTSMSAQVLMYLRSAHPHVNLNTIADEVGLPLAFMESFTNWMSIGAFLKLINAAVRKSGDTDLPYQVGSSALEGPVMNKAVRIFARSASTAALFRNMAVLSQFFNKVTIPQLRSHEGNNFVMRLMPNFSELDEDDRDDLRDFTLFTAENARGVYEAVPTAQDLPRGRASMALVERIDGIPIFEITVHLPELIEATGRWKSIAVGLLGGTLVSAVAWMFLSELTVPTLLMGLSIFIVLYLLHRLKHLSDSMKKISAERTIAASFHEKVLSDSESKYAQLLAASERLEKLTDSYRRFVPLEFLELIGAKSIFDVKPGVRKQHNLTVLFLDLRKSTELVTEKGNDAAFAILNSLNQALTNEIRRNRGLVDKFTGDGIMAVFQESTKDGLFAAEGCIKICERDFPWARLSIGFSCGTVLFGAVGTESDLRLTAQGDAVHLAARLESMNRQFDTEILIDAQTADLIRGELNTRSVQELGPQAVKGFPQLVKILTVFSAGHKTATGTSAKS